MPISDPSPLFSYGRSGDSVRNGDSGLSGDSGRSRGCTWLQLRFHPGDSCDVGSQWDKKNVRNAEAAAEAAAEAVAEAAAAAAAAAAVDAIRIEP